MISVRRAAELVALDPGLADLVNWIHEFTDPLIIGPNAAYWTDHAAELLTHLHEHQVVTLRQLAALRRVALLVWAVVQASGPRADPNERRDADDRPRRPFELEYPDEQPA